MTAKVALNRFAKASADASADAARDGQFFIPPTDIYETKDELIVEVEMPGVDTTSVEVTLEKRLLTVRGLSKIGGAAGYALAHAEYREGNYERSFMLSDDVEDNRIQADIKNGILRLTLPKAKAAKARIIPVKMG